MDYTVFQDQRGRFMVTLPKRLRKALGLHRGSRVRWEVAGRGTLTLRVAEKTQEGGRVMLEKAPGEAGR